MLEPCPEASESHIRAFPQGKNQAALNVFNIGIAVWLCIYSRQLQ